MKHPVTRYSMGALAAALLLTQTAQAQQPAPGLQDLVGARGGSGESALAQRGYQFVKAEKSGHDSYTYWRQERGGQCVIVRTAQGRYQSLVNAPRADCKGGASAGTGTDGVPAPGFDEHGSRFDTVCGVIAAGKTYRYKCLVEGAAPGGHGKTVLHYPDQKITLRWPGGKRVDVEFEGMRVQHLTFTRSEGNTQFIYEGKPYFYVSDPGAAEMEVKHFKGP